jgi:hypothetical protein
MIRQRLIALATQQAQFRDDGWEILHTELRFDRVVSLDVPGQDSMPLTGSIDRIDVQASTGAMRIIDYKSGDRPTTPQKAHHGRETPPTDAELEWIDLQLPLYDFIARADGCVTGHAVELGYILLPKESTDVRFVPASWSAQQLSGAIDAARDIVRAIRAGRFEPNREFAYESDAYSRLCHSRYHPGGAESDDDSESES